MWKEKIKEFIFLKDEDGKYVVDPEYIRSMWYLFPNLVPRKMTEKAYPGQRWTIVQEIEKYKQENNDEMVRTKILEFLETIVLQTMDEGYTSFTWPTIIAEQNLNMGKEAPKTEEEIWYTLYLIYTGVKFGKYIVNMENVSDEGRRWMWKTLVTSAAIMGTKTDFTPIRENLKVRFNPASEPYFSTLALLGFWVNKAAESWKGTEDNVEEWEKIVRDLCKNLGWSEDTSLVIFGRETKGVYNVFPQSIVLVRKWLNPETNLFQFLNSIVNISDNKLKKVAIGKREMLVYYLLRYHVINGELLSELVAMKCNAELKKDSGIYGIFGAKQFFKTL